MAKIPAHFRFWIFDFRLSDGSHRFGVRNIFVMSQSSNPKSFDRLVDQTVVERLLYVGLFGFGMIDKLQRVGHRLLRRPERAGESFPVKFKTALQNRFIFDSGKFFERPLCRRCVFPDELLSFGERA